MDLERVIAGVLTLTGILAVSVAHGGPCCGSGGADRGKGPKAQAQSAHTLTDLKDINQLRVLFNKDSGTTRIILIVSPTCSMCFRGAEWVQESILEPNPDSKVRVYAVWLPCVEGDSREEWKASRMPDPRVTHFWDEEKVLGQWFAKYLVPKSDWLIRTKAQSEWDAIYLYGPEASWHKTDKAPSPLVVWGRPILNVRNKVMPKIRSLLKLRNNQVP